MDVSCEYGDEPSVSGATELVNLMRQRKAQLTNSLKARKQQE
jgi:hypothetical protein